MLSSKYQILVAFIFISTQLLGQIDSNSIESDISLFVLGIAQDAGYPQIGCRKTCCQKVLSGERKPQKVCSLGILDENENRFWIVEASPNLVEQWAFMESLNEQKPDAAGIFISHAHIGHYTGLMYLGREAMGAQKIPVHCMPRMFNFLEQNGPWSQLVTLDNIKLDSLQFDIPRKVSPSLQLTPISVPHRDEFSETAGFIISGPNKQALFIPDIDKWEKWDRSIVSMIKEVDIAFLDGTFYENGELPNRDMSEIPHPFIEESLSLFSELSKEDRSKVHFIHFNHTNEAMFDTSEASNKITKEGYSLAREGMEFRL